MYKVTRMVTKKVKVSGMRSNRANYIRVHRTHQTVVVAQLESPNDYLAPLQRCCLCKAMGQDLEKRCPEWKRPAKRGIEL